MTALPAASLATNAAATQGDVKTFLTNLRDYLNGLLGSTGLPADARAALGVAAITLQNITDALGYVPANAANAATDHHHDANYAPQTAVANVVRYLIASNNTAYTRLTLINGTVIDREDIVIGGGGGTG